MVAWGLKRDVIVVGPVLASPSGLRCRLSAYGGSRITKKKKKTQNAQNYYIYNKFISN